MQVTLIGNKFVNDGYGVASASGLLYQYLQNRINVNAISLEDFKLPSVLKGIARRNLSLIAQSNRLNGLYLHSIYEGDRIKGADQGVQVSHYHNLWGRINSQ